VNVRSSHEEIVWELEQLWAEHRCLATKICDLLERLPDDSERRPELRLVSNQSLIDPQHSALPAQAATLKLVAR
jgi:hypothetical protein